MRKIGRNELCPCNSGKKYKRCHGGINNYALTSTNKELSPQPLPVPKFSKSLGYNDSENYLIQLCEKSFLSLWSWPNLHSDRTSNHPEICDLFVVFDNHIILFSDKYIEFNEEGFDNDERIKINWDRWYRKAIQKSVDTLYGAENWIRANPDRVYIDKDAKNKLPIDLTNIQNFTFHRVAVARGIRKGCIRYFGGGSGSLAIKSLESEFLFCILYDEMEKGFFHIFDDVSLEIVFKELDTITDFIAYLVKKEEFISQKKLISAAGEEDLLTYYLKNINEKEEHDFVLPHGNTAITIGEGLYEEYQSSAQYIQEKEESKISYIWDALIENLNKHHRQNTLEYGNNIATLYFEKAIRTMAAEPREGRKNLAEHLKNFVIKYQTMFASSRGNSKYAKKLIINDDVSYIFMLIPYDSRKPYTEYRQRRQDMLYAHCMVLKNKVTSIKKVIGIAFEPPTTKEASIDTVFLDGTIEWTKEKQKEAEMLARKLQISISIDS